MWGKTAKNYSKGDYRLLFQKKKKQPESVDVDAWEKEESDEIEFSTRGNYYQVEAVLDRKIEKGKKYYYVTWKNYPGDDSWEPEQNLQFLKGEIQALDQKIDRRERTSHKEPSLNIHKVIEQRIIKPGGYPEEEQEEEFQQITRNLSKSNDGEFSHSRLSERSTKSKCLFEDSFQDKDASAQCIQNKHRLSWRSAEKQISYQTQEGLNNNKARRDFRFGEQNNQTTEDKSKQSQVVNKYYELKVYEQMHNDEYLNDVDKETDQIIAEINKDKPNKTIDPSKRYATIINSLRWLGQQQLTAISAIPLIQNIPKTKPLPIQTN